MLHTKTLLHFDSSGHEHAHEHACHHEHTHEGAPELSAEQTLALMSYMLDHNRSHADELHNIAHALEAQGRHEAAHLDGDAVLHCGPCNGKLEGALRLVEGEGD